MVSGLSVCFDLSVSFYSRQIMWLGLTKRTGRLESICLDFAFSKLSLYNILPMFMQCVCNEYSM